MRNLFSIHPFTYVCLFIAFITGYFKDTIIFMTIIFIHEIGHVLTAIYFKWNIEKVVILPFGGLTIFNELINRPLIEEAIITIMGPFFQMIFTFLLNNQSVLYYSKIILYINLIPIYQLDGGKLLNVFLNKIFPFKLSHIISIYLSYIINLSLIFLMILKKEFIFLISLILLFMRIKDEIINHNFIFNKFLYERYLYKLKFKKIKIVKSLKKCQKDYYHYIDINSDIYSENEILKKIFH